MPNLKEAVFFHPALWDGDELFQFALNPDSVSLLKSLTLEYVYVFDILNFLAPVYKFPSVRSLALLHDYTLECEDKIFEAPIDGLYSHIRNHLSAQDKSFKNLTPEVVDVMFIGQLMWDDKCSDLHDVIKQCNTIHTQKNSSKNAEQTTFLHYISYFHYRSYTSSADEF